ncbi:MAG: alkaline phosphatase family protein [Lacisediminihabitans sp.]
MVAAGFAAGGVAGGVTGGLIGAAGSKESSDPALDRRTAPGFEHVVVLMYENRSFDNILGWLYTPDTVPAGQKFDGLAMGDYSNLAPDGSVIEAHLYAGATDTIMSHPNPDPGEQYPHVNTQLFGVVDPAANSELHRGPVQDPYNAPRPGQQPDNSGFVRDYEINFKKLSGGKPPTPEQLRVAMGGFSPEMLPVFSTLARNFAVFDSWFSAVPSQTFCNRSFFHASTSHGFVTNKNFGGFKKWLNAPASPTIFNLLEEAGLPWRVYYDEAQVVSLTGVLHAPAIQKYWKSNFRTMEQFYKDAHDGNLPAYSFVEPRMIFNHNDMHPPYGALQVGDIDGQDLYNSAVSDVRAGEVLLHEMYTAIRNSATTSGSNAENTLLLVTFDEHGGIYDHVPPPSAIPPDDGVTDTEMGFMFDRLGCRVPTIAISAYTAAGTVINDRMHHGAVIKTLSRLHGLPPLTARDETANDLFLTINRATPRPRAEWPDTHPQYVPPNAGVNGITEAQERQHPLSSPAEGLLGLLVTQFGKPGAPVPTTYGEAVDVLSDSGKGLFGTVD